jgi:hypothetical protein
MRVPSRGQVWGQLAAVQYRKTCFFSYLRANRDPHPSHHFPCASLCPNAFDCDRRCQNAENYRSIFEKSS